MVDMGISSNIMKSPSPKCNMTFWDMTIYNETPTEQTLHKFASLLPNWTLIPILNLLPNFGGFHRTLQRVRLANRGRLLLRTPGPVPFGTCICSNVETILSWTCHVYGPFEFRTSLGTSILLFFLIYIYTYHYMLSSKYSWIQNIITIVNDVMSFIRPKLWRYLLLFKSNGYSQRHTWCLCVLQYNEI